MDWNKGQGSGYRNPAGTPHGGGASIFGLISKVNKGILKKPKTISQQSPVTSLHGPSTTQSLDKSQTDDVDPEKQKAFLEAKTKVEQIQKRLWKTGSGVQQPRTLSEPFKVPQLPTLSVKPAQKGDGSQGPVNKPQSGRKPGSQELTSVKPLTSLVEYDDDDEELDKRGRSYNRKKALEEIDRYRAVTFQARSQGNRGVQEGGDQNANSREYDRRDDYAQSYKDERSAKNKDKSFLKSFDSSESDVQIEYFDAYSTIDSSYMERNKDKQVDRNKDKGEKAMTGKEEKYISSYEVFDYGHASSYNDASSRVTNTKNTSVDHSLSSKQNRSSNYDPSYPPTRDYKNTEEKVKDKPRRFEETKATDSNTNKKSDDYDQRTGYEMKSNYQERLEASYSLKEPKRKDLTSYGGSTSVYQREYRETDQQKDLKSKSWERGPRSELFSSNNDDRYHGGKVEQSGEERKSSYPDYAGYDDYSEEGHSYNQPPHRDVKMRRERDEYQYSRDTGGYWKKYDERSDSSRENSRDKDSKKDSGDMLYEEFLFGGDNDELSDIGKSQNQRSGSYDRSGVSQNKDYTSDNRSGVRRNKDYTSDRQKVEYSDRRTGYKSDQKDRYDMSYDERRMESTRSSETERDSRFRKSRWSGSESEDQPQTFDDRRRNRDTRGPAGITDPNRAPDLDPGYSPVVLGPGILCQDCNITCLDKEVFEVHLKSDLHLLNLQKKAQELFQMSESTQRINRFSPAEHFPLAAVQVPLAPPTVITGLPTSTGSQPLIGYPIGPSVYALDDGMPQDMSGRGPLSRSPERELGFGNQPGGMQVVPPKPKGPLQADSIGCNSINMSWGKLVREDEAMIDKYVVEYRNARETHWVTVGTTSNHDFVVDGLQENTDYLFRVFSVNGAEKSEILESVLITTRRRKEVPRRPRRPSPDRGRTMRERDRSVRDRDTSSREQKRSPGDRNRKSSRERDRTQTSRGDRGRPRPTSRDRDNKSDKADRDSRKTDDGKADRRKKGEKDSGKKQESKDSKEESKVVDNKKKRDDSTSKEKGGKSSGKEEIKDKEEGAAGKEKDEEGKKTEKSEKMEGDVGDEPVEDVECLLYQEIPDIEEQPLLGLEYLWEIVSYKPTVPVRYLCKLCNTKGFASNVMIAHVTGFPHKMEYFKKHNMTVFDTVSMIPSKKEQVERLNYEGKLVEDKQGRGAVKVMIMLNPEDTGGKIRFRDPVEVPAPAPNRDKFTGPVPTANMVQTKFHSYFREAVEIHELEDIALIGLSYLREYFHPSDEEPPRYICSLCNIVCTDKTVVFHVIGKKHRLAYLKVLDPTLWDATTKSRDMKKLIIQKAKEIEEKDGPGEMKSLVAKNARLWRHNIKRESALAEEDEEETGGQDVETPTVGEPMETETKTTEEKEENQGIKFGIKKSDTQAGNVKAINVLDQVKPKTKEAFDWNKENAALQSKIQNQTIIKSNRKSKFITVYSEFFKRYPVIGIQWVTEFQKPDPKMEPWYMCFMCQQKLQWKNILDHVTSSSHRINYMKKNHEEKYKSLLSTINTNKMRGRAVIENYSREIIKQEGPVSGMEVMLELSINTEALKSVMKVKEHLKPVATVTSKADSEDTVQGSVSSVTSGSVETATTTTSTGSQGMVMVASSQSDISEGQQSSHLLNQTSSATTTEHQVSSLAHVSVGQQISTNNPISSNQQHLLPIQNQESSVSTGQQQYPYLNQQASLSSGQQVPLLQPQLQPGQQQFLPTQSNQQSGVSASNTQPFTMQPQLVSDPYQQQATRARLYSPQVSSGQMQRTSYQGISASAGLSAQMLNQDGHPTSTTGNAVMNSSINQKQGFGRSGMSTNVYSSSGLPQTVMHTNINVPRPSVPPFMPAMSQNISNAPKAPSSLIYTASSLPLPQQPLQTINGTTSATFQSALNPSQNVPFSNIPTDHPFASQSNATNVPVETVTSEVSRIQKVIEKQAEKVITKQILQTGQFPSPGTKVYVGGENAHPGTKINSTEKSESVLGNRQRLLDEKRNYGLVGSWQAERGEKRPYLKQDQSEYFEENKKSKVDRMDWRKPDVRRPSRFDSQRGSNNWEKSSISYATSSSRNSPSLTRQTEYHFGMNERDGIHDKNKYAVNKRPDQYERKDWSRTKEYVPSKTFSRDTNISEEYYDDDAEVADNYDIPLSTRDVENLVQKYSDWTEDDSEAIDELKRDFDDDGFEHFEEWYEQFDDRELDKSGKGYQSRQYDRHEREPPFRDFRSHRNRSSERDDMFEDSQSSRRPYRDDVDDISRYGHERRRTRPYREHDSQEDDGNIYATNVQEDSRSVRKKYDYSFAEERQLPSDRRDDNRDKGDLYRVNRQGYGHFRDSSVTHDLETQRRDRRLEVLDRYSRQKFEGRRESNSPDRLNFESRDRSNFERGDSPQYGSFDRGRSYRKEPIDDVDYPKARGVSWSKKEQRWQEDDACPDPSREEIDKLLKKVSSSMMRMPEEERQSLKKDLARHLPRDMASLDQEIDPSDEDGSHQGRSYRSEPRGDRSFRGLTRETGLYRGAGLQDGDVYSRRDAADISTVAQESDRFQLENIGREGWGVDELHGDMNSPSAGMYFDRGHTDLTDRPVDVQGARIFAVDRNVWGK